MSESKIEKKETKPLCEWSESDVTEFGNENKLNSLKKAFEENKINGKDLLFITSEERQQGGITKIHEIHGINHLICENNFENCKLTLYFDAFI